MPSTRKSPEALTKKSRRGRIAVPVGTPGGAQPVEPATNIPSSTSSTSSINAAPNVTAAAQRPAKSKVKSISSGSPAKATAPSVKAVRKAAASAKSNDAPRRMSALDAAAEILACLKGAEVASGVGVNELIDRMEKSGLWKSPGGKTPSATLYSALIREISQRKGESRFRRIGPGRFVLATTSPKSGKTKLGSRADAGAKPEMVTPARKRRTETAS
ncbi:MAG: winged helix-turn-helix domain-containing protein [Phycisphaerales bacterium]|nr:winged helix-turn-helix domain-containing protein [Phycisphaerales bacterium]